MRKRGCRLRRHGAAILMVVTAGLQSGCGVLARPDLQRSPTVAPSDTRAVDLFRITSGDDSRWLAWMAQWADQRRALGLDGVHALAFSGGGANGAYGAGVLVGWSEGGDRPAFDLVTGVSTGALIAPFAFAGPAWDDRLAQAYADPDILALGRNDLGFLRRPSLRSGRPLRVLMERYIDEDLVVAVARRHRQGARLLVATTDLDSQRGVIWDLGAIADATATSGRLDSGLGLIRSILIASASIPGVLPPELIAVDALGQATEMHVDGGVTTPFFFVPEQMYFWRPEHAMRPLTLHLVINGQMQGGYRITRGDLPSILLRSADTLGRADSRTQLRLAQAFAERNGAPLAYAVIPDSEEANPLGFQPEAMSALFALGRDQALRGEAFVAAPALR